MLNSGCRYIVLMLFTLPSLAAEKPRSIFPEVRRMDTLLSDPEWGGLRSACEADIKAESHPVVDFSPLPHYQSSGVRSQATSDPGASLSRDAKAVYQLAICFQLSANSRFSSKAEALLDGWANTTKRISTDQGADEFNFNFPFALMGAYLLKQDASWDSNALTLFVRNIVVPANNAAHENNHGNWGVLLLATAGAYLDDQGLIDHARQRWLQLMLTQVTADGTLPLEICRSNTTDWCGGPTKGIKGIAYTHFTLRPVTIAAEVFRNLGLDVYSAPGGDQLRKAYTKAAAWTLHPETFPYFRSNAGKLEDTHSIDYFYILRQRFPISDGEAAIAQWPDSANGGLFLKELYSRTQDH
jgi:hypothetical protein